MRYNLLRWGASALALGCAMQAAPALAQDGSGGATALDPITVFATLSPTSSFDYPGQVSVVGRDDLETHQASTLGDVFAGVPGVFVDGGARRTSQSPTIRGIREEDILVLIDGARQSFISGHDGRLFIEPDLLKSVEIVKGPASSLYGSGALGGVIALTTVDATDFLEADETAGFRVKAGYESVADEMLFSTTAFARSKDGRFDVLGSFAYRQSGDIELGNGLTLPDDNEIKSSLLKANAELAPGLTVTTSWIHYQDDAITPNNPQRNTIPGVPDGDTIPVEVFRQVRSDTVTGKLSYAPADNPLIDGNLLVYYSRNEVGEDETDPASTRVLSREVDTKGINIDNRSRFDLSDWAKLKLTYGAEYYVDNQKAGDTCPLGGVGCGLPPGSVLVGNIPGGTADFMGVFTQAELKLDTPLGAPGELTLLPGVRWDRFTSESDGNSDFSETAVSPKFGATYKPVEWLMLFGSYGEAFRAPSYNELYAQGNHFPVFFSPRACPPSAFCGYNQFIPNPDLRPQDGNTIEAGLGFDFDNVVTSGDKLTIKGSYWTSAVSDFIDLNVVGAAAGNPADNGCFDTNSATACYSQLVNVADAELDGVEVELNYDSARLFGRAAYSTIDGRDKDTNDYLGSLTPDKLVFEAGVKVPEIWSRFVTRVTFADDFTKVNDPGEERDGYRTIDLYAVIQPLDGALKGFRLDLGIENVTDEAYETVFANSYEEGINYIAAVSWTQKW